MYRVFKVLEGLIGRLSLDAATAVGGGVGRMVGLLAGNRRREALNALKLSLPDLTPQDRQHVVRDMYRNLGRGFAEVFWYGARGTSSFADHMAVSPEDAKTVRNLKEDYGGFLILTAHLGNLELFATLALQFDLPMTAVVKRIRGEGASRYWTEKRHQLGVKTLPVKASFRECIQTVRGGETVAMVMDQHQPPHQGVMVDFFGRRASTSPGLAVLSAMTQAAVLPAFMVREGRTRHRLVLRPLIESPPDKSKETIRAYTQKYNDVLEDVIGTYPDQWIWMHRRWKAASLTEEELSRGR